MLSQVYSFQLLYFFECLCGESIPVRPIVELNAFAGRWTVSFWALSQVHLTALLDLCSVNLRGKTTPVRQTSWLQALAGRWMVPIWELPEVCL